MGVKLRWSAEAENTQNYAKTARNAKVPRN